MDGKNSEESLRPKVKKYLESLGYPSESILFEYSTHHYAKLDVVVKINDKVLIACEIKSKYSVGTSSEIGYNPIARKLQKEAEELEVKNYFISDGVSHQWLMTGSSGRPELTEPIPYTHFGVTDEGANFLYEKLLRVADSIRSNPITGDFLYDLSIILYYRIQAESRDNIPSGSIYSNSVARELSRFNNSIDNTQIKDIYRTLEYILDSEQLIKNRVTVFKFIDKIFEDRRTELSVPRWLADFMAKILDIQSGQLVVDLFSRAGMLTAASNLNGADRTVSLFNNDRDEFWIRIHQVLTGKEVDLSFEPSLLIDPKVTVSHRSVDRILIAPPFNLKFDAYQRSFYESGVNDSTAVLLEVALNSINYTGRIVAIVPEGFLNSGYFLKARKYFIKNAGIEAIISLPNNTFQPYSSVKTSLLVLTKKPKSRSFFASIEDAYNNSTKSIDINAQSQLLINLSRYRLGNDLAPSERGFIVSQISDDSLQYSKYWFDLNYRNTNAQGFITVPLKELTNGIFRGSPVVEDKGNGDMPFLSPSSVRKMMIIKESLSYSSRTKIPSNSLKPELDDIIVNSISSYRGAAALVSPEYVGLPINRHLFLIKPNKNLVLPGYLSVVLNSEVVAAQLLDRSSGIIPSLNKKSFDGIYIPLPSMAQQERIYDEFSQLAAAISKTESELSVLSKRFYQKLNQLGKEDSAL